MANELHIIFLLGCTGSGKGAVGRALAKRVNAEILSVDSMKVYRRMDIGTAKPGAHLRADPPHHLIDIVEPSEEFSVAQFVARAESAAADITQRHRVILAVGGTALYVKALAEGLFEGPSANPEVRARLHSRAAAESVGALHAELSRVDPSAAQRIDRRDLRRIVRALEVHEITGQAISTLQQQWDRDRTKHRCTFLGLRRELADQNQRTNLRVRRLMEMGWLEEVRSLLSEPRPLSTSARQALGYRELIEHLEGRMTLDKAVEQIKIGTRQLAKAQRTWFKRFRAMRWFDVSADEGVECVVERILMNGDLPNPP